MKHICNAIFGVTILATGFFVEFVHAEQKPITKVSVSNFSIDNLCIFLGGKSKRPTITIHHTPNKVGSISIVMFDETSDGKYYTHGKKSVKLNKSGNTVVRPLFFPPSNYTGSISKYQFTISISSHSETILWANYDSAQKRVF